MKKLLSLGLLLASFGLLVSCGPGQARSEKGVEKVSLNFPQEYKSDKEAIKGGEYRVGLVTSSPFKGIFSPLHSTDNYDSTIYGYFTENIYWNNEDFEIVDVEGGMATLSLDKANKEIVIKFREGLKWSDGHALGVDDLIYTFEVLGHPDYNGVRYSEEDHGKILGMNDYHSGKADKISGLVKVSDTELRIKVSELDPKLITGGGAVLSTSRLLPKHYLSDVAMKDLETSDKIRKTPLSYGAFVLTKLVPGESVELVANEHYWAGRPTIDKVIIKTLSPQLAVESMKNGEYHSYSNLPTDAYEKYSTLDNFALIGMPDLYIQYLGFNLGHYDEAKGENIMDRDTPLQDVKVRQALAYALNIDEITDVYYKGLRQRANGQTPPIFKKYYDASLEGYPYNPEKAKALLAEAGYKDSDGDGIVDKDGKKLTLQYATMAGSDTAEPIAQAYIQWWKEIGVEVTLTTGRLLDFNLFYDKVQANSSDIDIYMAAWGVGTSLDPSQSGGRDSKFNMTRFVSEENDKLLKAISDPKGLDDVNYKANAYKAWQKYYVEQAVEVPLMFRYRVVPINKSIKYANTFTDSARGNYQTELVSAEPVKASN